MVEEECRRYRPTKNYLENAGPEPSTAFETPALQREMERVQQRLPMEPLSMKRLIFTTLNPNVLIERETIYNHYCHVKYVMFVIC